MNHRRTARLAIIAAVLLLGLTWSLALAMKGGALQPAYPNAQLLATVDWLAAHAADPRLLIVDVREDKHHDGRSIPGAVRLPWTTFRYDDAARNLPEKFVGVAQAQEILGRHGITRDDTLVLYDSVARDGGATASFVFWVLDILGHRDKRILDGGVDAWVRAGQPTETAPRAPSPVLYQAPAGEIRLDQVIDGRWIQARLGDPMYQIIDVRSREEYLGTKGSMDMRGNPMLAGHIPTAVNVEYTSAWQDKATKLFKPYPDLQTLYSGLDPSRGVIVYCQSGRRSAFSYFVLRLMGVERVLTYENSWMEWGNPDNFFPVETVPRQFAGDGLPGVVAGAVAAPKAAAAPAAESSRPTGGYVSCGG
jgi:thiosulfate/3-mercaptopyruvate sulfurtransferase